jgi:hypothetical protein
VNWRRHGVAAAVALLWFLVMSVLSQSWGPATLIAAACILLACTASFLHYRRRVRSQALVPTTPARDDRVIPRDVRVAVIARDGGKCQLRYPGICLVDRQIDIDHIYPWSLGGSSKDIDNLQCACHPCNAHKSNKVLV